MWFPQLKSVYRNMFLLASSYQEEKVVIEPHKPDVTAR